MRERKTVDFAVFHRIILSQKPIIPSFCRVIKLVGTETVDEVLHRPRLEPGITAVLSSTPTTELQPLITARRDIAFKNIEDYNYYYSGFLFDGKQFVLLLLLLL